MSALTDALAEFLNAFDEYRRVRAAVAWASKAQSDTAHEETDRRLASAGDAYETALAQFTADVARHAVT